MTVSRVSTKPEIEIDFRDVQNLILPVCDCGGHIFPRKNANFGRFEVAFDRPEFDKTQVLVIELFGLMTAIFE